MNSVADAVGLSSSTQSTSGTSTPSPSTSTENTPQSSGPQLGEALFPHLGGVVARQRNALKPRLSELPCHVPGVLLRHAEAQCSHAARVQHDALNRLEALCDADIVVREQVAELFGCVTASTPRQLAQIRAIGHAEVLERDEEALIDRLPQAQLDSDPVVEPPGDIATIKPFRCCREAKQFSWLQAAQQTVVAVGSRMMKLVHYNHIERIRRDLVDPPAKRLDHREHMTPVSGTAATKDFAEVAAAQHSSIDSE